MFAGTRWRPQPAPPPRLRGTSERSRLATDEQLLSWFQLSDLPIPPGRYLVAAQNAGQYRRKHVPSWTLRDNPRLLRRHLQIESPSVRPRLCPHRRGTPVVLFRVQRNRAVRRASSPTAPIPRYELFIVSRAPDEAPCAHHFPDFLQVLGERDLASLRGLDLCVAAEDLERRPDAGEDEVRAADAFALEALHPVAHALGQFTQTSAQSPTPASSGRGRQTRWTLDASAADSRARRRSASFGYDWPGTGKCQPTANHT